MANDMDKRRKNRRAARKEERGGSPLLQMPFRLLRNRLPPLELVSTEQVEQLHKASMDILENVGLRFLDDKTLDIWERAGAKVDRATNHAWLERGLAGANLYE
jgi:trimethylamine--corrinoid protein Co-methyltransferase